MASRTNKPTYDEWMFSLPKQWRHYTSSDLRKDIDWFQSLLRAYDLHMELFLDTLSKSSREGTQITFPIDTDDESFDNFVLKKYCRNFQCTPTPKHSKGYEVNRELCDCIAKCLEKKLVLIKLGQMSSENKRWQSDIQTAVAEKLEAQQLLEDNKVKTLRLKDEVEKLTKTVTDIKDEIKKERERSAKMLLKLQEITKDKEDLLIRLSKIAGSKLTFNNPDIADLSDGNRPTKLAEKFGQLYDDAWTDSLEELTEVEAGLDEGVAIGFLLQILLTAYQFCRGSRSMFLDLTDCQTIMTCANLKDMKVLIRIPEASTADIQPRAKMSLHAKETVSEMQKKFVVILKGIFHDINNTKKCCPSVSDELKTNPWELDGDEVKETNALDNRFTTNVYIKDVINVLQSSKEEPANMLRHTEFSKYKKKTFSHSARGDFLQPRCKTYSQDGFALKKEDMQKMLTFPYKSKAELAVPKTRFPKTTHFAERCVELCWFMQTTQPPIHLSARIPDDGKLNTDIFRPYTKSGKEVDYIVWPVMYLHENGPLLTKGIAQPN